MTSCMVAREKRRGGEISEEGLMCGPHYCLNLVQTHSNLIRFKKDIPELKKLK
jgi:hypothetical protein